MGKVAAVVVAKVILAVVGVGCLVADSLGAFDSPAGDALPNTPKEFQRKDNQGRCFSESEIFDKWATKGQIWEAKTIKDVVSQDDVKWDDSASPVEPKGCLEYSWKLGKGKYRTRFWESRFRFVWVLRKNNTAFAVYLTAEGINNWTFEFDGIAYVFRRDKEGGEWRVDKKLRANKKTLSDSGIKDKFPKKGTGFPKEGSPNDYWNFLTNDASDTPRWKGRSGHKYVLFQHKENDGVGVGTWSSNLEAWWEHFFDNSKWNMAELITNVNGEWKNK